MAFRDRSEAARLLADRLAAYRGRNPLVMAIPRGGVPMARIVADALEGELDVILVHKLGAPSNPEYAVGAVDESGQVTVGEAARVLMVPQSHLDAEVHRRLEELHARRRLYGVVPANPAGRVVIVVDDGVATGMTLLAALGALRAKGPERLVAAVGVAAPEAAGKLREAVDELICLETPISFYAVGQFYEDFSQVTDDEVVAALQGGGAHERRPENGEE